MQKRLLRYLSALIASLVCTYAGIRQHAAAEGLQTCGLSDVAAWQVALEPNDVEATPAYIQSVTEGFLARCPGRPEAGEAHRIAGLAASWADNIEAAAAHFEKMGYVTDSEALLMHAAVRFSLGEPDRAATLRDKAIDAWLDRIQRNGLADIETEETRYGEIIQVKFRKTGPELRISHLWIARPDEPAWPAALSVSSERQLNAFHRLRAGADAPAQTFIRLYRCQARKLLAQTPELNESDMEAAAGLSLTAYLANPDTPAPGDLDACLFDNRILPGIRRSDSVPVQ